MTKSTRQNVGVTLLDCTILFVPAGRKRNNDATRKTRKYWLINQNILWAYSFDSNMLSNSYFVHCVSFSQRSRWSDLFWIFSSQSQWSDSKNDSRPPTLPSGPWDRLRPLLHSSSSRSSLAPCDQSRGSAPLATPEGIVHYSRLLGEL